MTSGPDRLDRLDFETLLDWLEGRLDPVQAARVAEVLPVADARTRATADWLRGFLHATSSVHLESPPPVVRQSLRQEYARWKRSRGLPAARSDDGLASLMFDSRRDVAGAGLRGAEPAETFHLAFAAANGDLLIDVSREGPDRLTVDGQVLIREPTDGPDFTASLSGPGFGTRVVEGDPLGRFSFRDVREQACRLQVSNGVLTLVAELDLAPGDA